MAARINTYYYSYVLIHINKAARINTYYYSYVLIHINKAARYGSVNCINTLYINMY